MTHPATPEMMPEPENLPGNVWRGDHTTNEMVDGPWEPGDPIWLGHGTYTRQMFQLLPDNEGIGTWWDHYWCHNCDVFWACWAEDPAEAPCWLCDQPTASPSDEKERELRLRLVKERW